MWFCLCLSAPVFSLKDTGGNHKEGKKTTTGGLWGVANEYFKGGVCARAWQRQRDTARERETWESSCVFLRATVRRWVTKKGGSERSRRLEDQHQRQRRVKTMLCQKVIPDVFIYFLMAIIFAYTSKKNLQIYEWVMYRIKKWHILHLSLWLPVTAFFWYLKCLYWTVMYFFQSLLSSCLSLSWKTHF